MIRVRSVLNGQHEAVDEVVLDLEGRRKRRQVIGTAAGERILIDLAEAPHLRDGENLELEDGRIVRVRARAEKLVEIVTDDPVRIAWHLGNRHLPTQIIGERMRIREDHVIEHMLEGLGCRLERVEAPFDPEGGAYGGHATHHHHHDHD
ncbi:MAG: urease accessory protein UreE [Geminicoccaceae bacterium]|nr:urease accessory protein UreE [Geminicoccaceae bacterium]